MKISREIFKRLRKEQAQKAKSVPKCAKKILQEIFKRFIQFQEGI